MDGKHGMVINVNGHPRLDKRVRENPDLLVDIIGSAMDAILAVDDAQRIVLFNPAAEKMFCCPANEAMGTSVERFIPQRFRVEHSNHVQRFAASGLINRTLGGLNTLWGLRATGEEFPIEASISEVESGGQRFLTAVIRDITERRRAEEAVRESEERFRLVADTAPVLMWMSGTDKLCTYFNKPWLDFTGRSLEQELGNAWADGVHPEDLHRCLDTYTQFFDRRENFKREYRLRRYDGEYRWVLDMGVPRFNQDRSFAGYIGIGIDVTERRRAEEARFRHAAIVESSDDAIIGTDASGTVTDWNKGAEWIFGYSEKEAIGRNVSFLAPTDRPDEVQRNLKKIVNGDVVKPYETVRRRKDGNEIDVSLTASPIFDAEDRIVGAAAIARDITERKRAEDAVRESEIQYRRIVETTNEGVWLLDSKLHTSYVNRQMAEMLGYEPREMVGRSVFDFYFPPDVEYKKQALSRRQQGVREQLDERLQRRDGSELWVRMAATPVFKDNGEFDGAMAMMSDITEGKLAEEALRQSEERLRLAAQAGKMYAYEWDIATDVLVRSAQYVNILGATEPKRSTRQQFLSKIHPDDRPKFVAAIAELTPANPIGEVTYRVLLPSGTIWLKNSGRAFFNGEGRMLRVIGMVADVTDHKQTEEALSGMTRKLVEAQEQERTRIARELHDDISQRLALLAVELGQVQEDRPDLPPDILHRMHELREQTTQISTDVQALSHDLHSSHLEYLGVVAGMKSWCKQFGEKQGIQIDCRHDVQNILPPEIGLCLFRVLQEALHNAAKHSRVKRIDVQLQEAAGEIHLIVRDSGTGFDVEAVKHGKGLGLTSMRERVRLVNGTILIESKLMGGTTVRVSVPFRPEQTTQRAAG